LSDHAKGLSRTKSGEERGSPGKRGKRGGRIKGNILCIRVNKQPVLIAAGEGGSLGGGNFSLPHGKRSEAKRGVEESAGPLREKKKKKKRAPLFVSGVAGSTTGQHPKEKNRKSGRAFGKVRAREKGEKRGE